MEFPFFKKNLIQDTDIATVLVIFMEAHPAHNSLPAKAKIEAMDVLTWAWMGKWVDVGLDG